MFLIMGDHDDILYIAKYFIGRYGAAAAELMEGRASACEHEGDADAAGLWRCVAARIRETGAAAKDGQGDAAAGSVDAPKGASDSHVRRAFEATPHPYLLLTPDLRIAGAEALLGRIKDAAKKVCAPAPHGKVTLQERSDYKQCLKDATEEAVNGVNSPALTAAYQAKA